MNTTQPIRDTAQLKAFKNYYKETNPNPRNYLLCILGLNTALRITDLLQLRWCDVYDFSRKEWHEHITLTEKKTGKSSIIAINASVKAALFAYLKSGAIFIPERYLFASRKGTNVPIRREQAFRIVKEAAAAAGCSDHISCHSLRKTFGYHAWQQGISPVLLMDIYNHSSYRITKRYLGIEQDERDSVFLQVNL